MTIGWVAFVLICAIIYTGKQYLYVTFLPLILEGILIGAAILLVYFRVPERWFQDSRFINLYLNSYVIYTLFFINFVFESQAILFLTLKQNDGTLQDGLAWYKVNNIYNE